MESYRRWVLANRQFIASVESLAQTLTWFLPERFSGSEIAAEAVSSGVGLMSVINQHIIETSPTNQVIGVYDQRHVKYASEQDIKFPWSLCISAVKEVEVLVEVAAENYLGKDEKWSVVAATEAVKALLRLILLHKSGYKILIDEGTTANTADTMSMDQQQEESAMLTSWEMHPNYRSHNLEGRTLRALHKFGKLAQGAHSALVKIEEKDSSPDKNFLEAIQQKHAYNLKGGVPLVAAEILFILRPLVYVMLIKRFGLKSWKPWLLSLAMDFVGMSILTRLSSAVQTTDGGSCKFSKIEQEELKRRKLLWAFYVMRDPFFTRYTRDRLQYSEKLLGPIPIFGSLAAKAVELLEGVQTRYFYISAS